MKDLINNQKEVGVCGVMVEGGRAEVSSGRRRRQSTRSSPPQPASVLWAGTNALGALLSFFLFFSVPFFTLFTSAALSFHAIFKHYFPFGYCKTLAIFPVLYIPEPNSQPVVCTPHSSTSILPSRNWLPLVCSRSLLLFCYTH